LDDFERICAALDYMKHNPGTTLEIPSGIYVITTKEARVAQSNVMSGLYGNNPEPVMFNPFYKYSRGMDFDGHNGSTVIAYGVTLMIDGFMEPVSIRNCQDVTIYGLTIDHKRKPYSKGIINDVRINDDGVSGTVCASFDESYPICENMPAPRYCTYDKTENRFDLSMKIKGRRMVSHQMLELDCKHINNSFVGRELYLWHTYHSRPAVLIYKAQNTVLRDIKIHSNPGMGITAQQSENIDIERLEVIPSAGEHMATNTDATHFASCRGKLRLDGCIFEGQGDDSINVHTYYYTIEKTGGNTCRLTVKAPTGTHAQALDYPLVGDTLELTYRDCLLCSKKYKVVRSEPNFEGMYVDVVLDDTVPDYTEKYFFADSDSLPELEFRNCSLRNHFARGIMLKCRHAIIDNCIIMDSVRTAIKIAAEGRWHEGTNTEDVVISNCHIVNCGIAEKNNADGTGGISVSVDAEEPMGKPHRKITIKDNIIECPDVEHCISISGVEELIIQNNKLISHGEGVIIKDYPNGDL